MDLFLFTSRGTDRDKETMPLVIREAISNQIPTLIYNLPVYLNYFDKFETINYLKFDDFKVNCDKIAEKLGIKESNPNEEIFILSTFPISDTIIETTLKTIDSIPKFAAATCVLNLVRRLGFKNNNPILFPFPKV